MWIASSTYGETLGMTYSVVGVLFRNSLCRRAYLAIMSQSRDSEVKPESYFLPAIRSIIVLGATVGVSPKPDVEKSGEYLAGFIHRRHYGFLIKGLFYSECTDSAYLFLFL